MKKHFYTVKFQETMTDVETNTSILETAEILTLFVETRIDNFAIRRAINCDYKTPVFDSIEITFTSVDDKGNFASEELVAIGRKGKEGWRFFHPFKEEE